MSEARNFLLQENKRGAYTVSMKLSAYLSERGRKTLLAQSLGVPPQLVWQWSAGVRPVPLSRCVSIEQATAGQVSRRDLRPDDWHLYWPELADQPHAQA